MTDPNVLLIPREPQAPALADPIPASPQQEPPIVDLGLLPDSGSVLSMVNPAQARHVRAALRASKDSGDNREIIEDFLARSLFRIDGKDIKSLDDLSSDDYLVLLGEVQKIQAELSDIDADRRRTIQFDGEFYSTIGRLPDSDREVAKLAVIKAKTTRDARARAKGDMALLVENIALYTYLLDGRAIDPIELTTTLSARDYFALYTHASGGSGKGLSPLPSI